MNHYLIIKVNNSYVSMYSKANDNEIINVNLSKERSEAHEFNCENIANEVAKFVKGKLVFVEINESDVFDYGDMNCLFKIIPMR